MYEGQQFSCALYEKDGKQYVLYAEDGKLILIFKLHEGATMPFSNEDMILVWKAGWREV